MVPGYPGCVLVWVKLVVHIRVKIKFHRLNVLHSAQFYFVPCVALLRINETKRIRPQFALCPGIAKKFCAISRISEYIAICRKSWNCTPFLNISIFLDSKKKTVFFNRFIFHFSSRFEIQQFKFLLVAQRLILLF